MRVAVQLPPMQKKKKVAPKKKGRGKAEGLIYIRKETLILRKAQKEEERRGHERSCVSENANS